MSKHRTLLVEDNPENRYLATFLLERAGFEVMVSQTGEDALMKVQQERPNSVLLDIQLPDIDGYEIARRIKSVPANAALPIIAVSSFALPGEKQRATEAGCIGYIEKPIDPLKFAENVKEFLSLETGMI